MEADIDVAEDHPLDEFDSGTNIMLMTDGTLRLRLGLMPPSWATHEGVFESLSGYLADALGLEVEGLDKEFFGIYGGGPDTVARLRELLLELRRRHDRGG
jgi:hypothetical protein